MKCNQYYNLGWIWKTISLHECSEEVRSWWKTDEVRQWEKSICDTDTSVLDQPNTPRWIVHYGPLVERVLRWQGELVARLLQHARLPWMGSMPQRNWSCSFSFLLCISVVSNNFRKCTWRRQE